MRDELKVVTAPSEEPHWYALRVRPQAEYLVAFLLRKQGVRTMVPTETRFRRRTRYQKAKAEFAHTEIPSCVFAGFDGEPAWFHLLRNRLILGVEGFDGVPWRMRYFGKGGLFEYFSHTLDGCLEIISDKDDERYGMRLVHVQGRGLIRSPTTQVRTVSGRHTRKKGEVVVEPIGRRARLLARFALPQPEPVRAAA